MLAAAEAAGEGNFASFEVHPWQWGALLAFLTVLVVADLLIVHRKPHVITFKEAAIESAIWISIGVAFTGVIFGWHGGQAATEYISGFLVEKSLSIDNVFVWAVIFSFFGVPRQYQFRVLFWGIFGALVLRAAFIFAGVALIERFEWVLYVFGVFLLYTAWKIAHHDETEEVDYSQNLALRAVRKVIPSSEEYDGQKLFTKKNGKRLATPLFAVLVLIETTDVVFAVDSVPAVLAISREQFIVFSSTAVPSLGLRSLVFLLSGLAGKFRYLNVGLGVILGYVGLKMLAVGKPLELHPPTWLSLVVIAVVLTVAIVASLKADKRDGDRDDSIEHEMREAGVRHDEDVDLTEPSEPAGADTEPGGSRQ
ncbi:MAG: TerC family protein [Acidimicrobiales bacterium]